MSVKLYIYEAHYLNYAVNHVLTAKSEGEAWKKARKYENKNSGPLLNVELQQSIYTDIGVVEKEYF